MICMCQRVHEDRIEAACRDGARSLEEVRMQTGAGTGCGDCAEDIEEIVLDASS